MVRKGFGPRALGLGLVLLVACIDDERQPAGIVWGSGASGAFVGDTISLLAFYHDAAGDPLTAPLPSMTWTSSRPTVAEIVSGSLAVARETGLVAFTGETVEGPNYTLTVSFEIVEPWTGRLVWVGSVGGGQPSLFVRQLPGHEIRRIPEFAYPGSGHGDPYLSRDGSKVAAIATRPIAPAAPSTIFIVDLADSSAVAPFDALGGYQIAPVWMPGDSLLAFLMLAPTGWEVFTARPDGSELLQRTVLRQTNVPPFFDVTPDGHLVLPLRPTLDLYELTLTGDTVRRLTTEYKERFSPTVSPDGSMIAFSASGGAGAWIMNRDGSNLRELLPRRRVPMSPITAADAGGYPWSWTPDSRWVLVAWAIDPKLVHLGNYIAYYDVYAIRVADGLAVRLTRGPVGGGQASFW